MPIGTRVAVTIDNTMVRKGMAPDCIFKIPIKETLIGIIVDAPVWLKGPHTCILNERTDSVNLIPQHRILSINDKVIPKVLVKKDLVYQVTSSRTGERYTVTMHRHSRRWTCTCTGWQFHNTCRHVKRCELKAEKIHISVD